jgi:hypothetical protein
MKNERLKAIAAKVAAMSEDQRAAIAEQMPVISIAGHVISARNTCLLSLQLPGPVTVVGGFRQWLDAGRCVRKGESAAYILKPATRKARAADGAEAGAEAGPDGSGETAVSFYVPVPVFDVSQTDILQEVAK